MRITRWPSALALATSLVASSAAAQAIATDDLKKKTTVDPKKSTEGWKVKAKVGGSFSLNDSRSVVGAQDGTSIQVGLVLGGDANWKSGQHRWETSMNAQYGMTKPPQQDALLKSLDQLDLISTYFYSLESPDWLGPFVRVSLTAPMTAGYVNKTQTTRIFRDNLDGATNGQSTLDADRPRKLTDPFEATTLRQSGGFFADPYKEKIFTLGLRGGVAAQQVNTQGGDKFEDATIGDEAVIIVTQLSDTTAEAGAELEMEAKGKFAEDLVSWKLKANAFYPLLASDETAYDTCKAGDDLVAGNGDDEGDFGCRINFRITAGLSLKLAKWLSADYVLNLQRNPVVTKDVQVQNGLLLTAGFDLL